MSRSLYLKAVRSCLRVVLGPFQGMVSTCFMLTWRETHVYRPGDVHNNSRQLRAQEIALLTKERFDISAELWHLRLGHLNFADTCKLRTKAAGVHFKGEACYCQTCTISKMKQTPFQNMGILMFDQSRMYVLMSDNPAE